MTTQPVSGDLASPNYLWWNITAGAIFAIAATLAAPLVGLEISNALNNNEGQVTSLTLFLGIFLMGCLFWWLLMSRPQRFSLARGAVTGILVAFASYPVVLTLTEFVQRDPAGITALEDRLRHLVLGIGLTLVTTGFPAIVFMAVVGMFITWALVRFHPATAVIAARNAQRRGPAFRLLTRLSLAAASLILIALAASFVWLSLIPIDTQDLATRPSPSVPAQSYDDAVAAVTAIQTKEATMTLHERCGSTLLTHGAKVGRVVVYFHGLTSCPAQADVIAANLFAMGYNVYLPRMFGHGEADPMTLAMVDLTAEDLVDLANQSVDLSQGLGDEVVVLGLSAGGTIASWVAQYRADVDTSIAVSPFFGPYVVPAWANQAAANLMLALPNMMMWWNPLETVRPPEMDYAYARYATHALAEIMRLGRLVDASARTTPPAATHIAMLLNEADVAVNRDLALQVVTSWRSHGQQVRVETLPFARHLPHDLMDAREPIRDIDLVQSILLDMMNTP